MIASTPMPTLPLLPFCVARVPAALRRMLAQEGVPVVDFSPGRPTGTFVLYDARLEPAPRGLLAGQRLIDTDALRRDEPSDPFAVDDAGDEAGETVRSVWSVGPWEVGEETAAIDCRAVRNRVLGRLRAALIQAGGVWIRIAAFPRPYRTAANFRFDHDAYDAGDFDVVLRTIRGHEGMTTHFVCGATHEPHPEALARLRGLDVGSHGHHHHTYRTREENVRNIGRCLEVLRRRGIEPRGFAAPHGRFNIGLSAALAELGITHSSEFAAAYDDLPFDPPNSRVLQLPVHPVCLGIVLEAAQRNDHACDSAAAAAATADYLAAVVAEKHAAGEPIFLYGHPDGRVGRHPEILTRVFEAVDALPDVWQVTLSEFHRWWRCRAACRFSVWGVDGGYEVRAERSSSDYEFGLEYVSDDGVAAIALQYPVMLLEPEKLHLAPRPAVSLSLRRRAEPLQGWKQRLRRYLDWEYETPTSEIDASHWRGWVKRSLRTVKGPRRSAALRTRPPTPEAAR